MTGLLEAFRRKITASIHPGGSVLKDSAGSPAGHPQAAPRGLNEKVALGVLLWAVAEADDRFLPKEREAIADILRSAGRMTEGELAVVLAAVQLAARERIDIHSFIKDAGRELSRQEKRLVLENLFRVGCMDGDLDIREHETIRMISLSFQLEHGDFIEAKIKVKKEFGLDTGGI